MSKIFPIILTLSLMSACGNKSDSVKPMADETVVFVNGDPMTFASGYSLQSQSFINLRNMPQFEEKVYLETTYFITKTQVTSKKHMNSSVDAQAGQEAPTGSVKKMRIEKDRDESYAFEKMGNRTYREGREDVVRMTYRYSPKKSYADSPKEFYFAESEDGTLNLVNIKMKSTLYKATGLHYSSTTDKKNFSILFSMVNTDGSKSIGAAYFNKYITYKPIPRTGTKEKFYYMYGTNVAVTWPVPERNIKIRLCLKADQSAYRPALQKMVEKSIAEWNEAADRSVTLSFDPGVGAGPVFSDLNTKCVYVSEQYQVEPRTRVQTRASTLTRLNIFEQYLVDSDITIYAKELQKFLKPGESFLADPRLQRTITHEMGHLLGLHHQFDGVESIMSYRRTDNRISSYDKRALKELYLSR